MLSRERYERLVKKLKKLRNLAPDEFRWSVTAFYRRQKYYSSNN